MFQRLVRCPFCSQRYEVGGLQPGTRLTCAWCSRILTVPQLTASERRRAWLTKFFPRPWMAQVFVGCTAGILTIVLVYGVRALLGSSAAKEDPLSARLTEVHPAPLVKGGVNDTSRGLFETWEDKVRRIINDLYLEFGSNRLEFEERRPFLVAVEMGERFVAAELAEEYLQRLEALERAFNREFAQPLKLLEVRDVLPVVVLNSRESYEAYGKRVGHKSMSSQVTGIYEYSRRRIVLYHDARSPYEVILHEGIHGLIHYYTRQISGRLDTFNTYWFQEGMAAYFEGFRRDDKGQVVLVPGINRNRLPILKQVLSTDPKSLVALEKLVGMSVKEFWDWYDSERDDPDRSRKAQLYYAEPWALVYFLRTGEKGNYQKAFQRYFRAELEGTGGKEAFESALREELAKQVGDLEQEFIAFVKSLE